ncbi:hypothetical protein [Candidatus Halobonum tyrrellensis]|uniref:Uncharacterized protein n=1 Tax=Candidatus Halobonum tyrrellensis G22 TaxID=1324957 RepID=V4HII5_9EURY|nr:hypothetical protein [Candidatus Halobonum tyrrellensis]ESP89593.1 hypothetical protein K933_03515 [Candidatus Halobonum tyrrellensis G22]
MDSEAGDDPDGGPGGTGRDAAPEVERSDGPEIERLRRENRRLKARLDEERQRRADLIDRYEALLPDGSDTDGDGRVSGDRGAVAARTERGDGDGDDADGRAANAVRDALLRGVAWGRRRVRALRSRR